MNKYFFLSLAPIGGRRRSHVETTTIDFARIPSPHHPPREPYRPADAHVLPYRRHNNLPDLLRVLLRIQTQGIGTDAWQRSVEPLQRLRSRESPAMAERSPRFRTSELRRNLNPNVLPLTHAVDGGNRLSNHLNSILVVSVRAVGSDGENDAFWRNRSSAGEYRARGRARFCSQLG